MSGLWWAALAVALVPAGGGAYMIGSGRLPAPEWLWGRRHVRCGAQLRNVRLLGCSHLALGVAWIVLATAQLTTAYAHIPAALATLATFAAMLVASVVMSLRAYSAERPPRDRTGRVSDVEPELDDVSVGQAPDHRASAPGATTLRPSDRAAALSRMS